jgi:hypothetical protein
VDSAKPLSAAELSMIEAATSAVPLPLRGRRWPVTAETRIVSLTTIEGDQVLYGGRGRFIEPALAEYLATVKPELVARMVAEIRAGRDQEPAQATPPEGLYCYVCAAYHQPGPCPE